MKANKEVSYLERSVCVCMGIVKKFFNKNHFIILILRLAYMLCLHLVNLS